MKIEELYRLFLNCKNVATDSRIVKNGALFFALKGENFDGNKYAESALTNGCSYAIIDNKEYKKDNRYILVDNVLISLQQLGNYHRKKLNIPILAITGSNGKTTTKELIASVLVKKYTIAYTQGNLNNHIGVPLTLLSMNPSAEIGIVEMGANHLSEIEQLCEIAEPDYGLITNIGKAHLEGFGSFENIIKAKTELYHYLSSNSGKIFYNSQNEILTDTIQKLEVDTISYNSKEAKVKGKLQKSDQFLSVNAEIDNLAFNIQTKLVGNYNLENVLAAVCIGNYFDVSTKQIKIAIEEYEPKNNRSQFIKTTRNNLYLDAYNANPTSVELSLKNFVSLGKENSAVILGDMLELGKSAKIEHEKIIQLLQENSFNKVILVGSVYRTLQVPEDFLQFKDVIELKVWLKKNKIEHSNVLIKGSRGIRLETIVENL